MDSAVTGYLFFECFGRLAKTLHGLSR